MAVTARKIVPPPHLLQEFDWSEVPFGRSLGLVPAGSVVELVVLDVLADFDGGVSVEVGRSGAPAELVLGTDSNLAIVNRYQVACDHQYVTQTELWLTLLLTGPLPSRGAGRVLVYLN
jgi:hypothetical protein